VRAVGGEGVEPSEDEVTLLTPFIAVAGVGTFVALIALGIAVRRTRALPPGYASLPLAMGLGAVPLLIIGAALESVSERLFELPIALLGLGWIGLGIALWKRRATADSGDGRSRETLTAAAPLTRPGVSSGHGQLANLALVQSCRARGARLTPPPERCRDDRSRLERCPARFGSAADPGSVGKQPSEADLVSAVRA